ncbi:MAG: hypothetical protein IPK33_04600 [Gemmatimonadetes bacterium]|nr:hypothetical protein [Gemmatimonadota bacterium]
MPRGSAPVKPTLARVVLASLSERDRTFVSLTVAERTFPGWWLLSHA